MKDVAVCTIVSKNYIPYARTLMNRVKKFHPEISLFLLLADELNNEFNPENEVFELVEAKDLGIENFEQMTFMYDIMEFNTAIKPFFLNELLEKEYKKVIYLDSDILLFNKLDIVLNLLDDHAIVLTPHITAEMPEDGLLPPEQDLLKYGTYNLGFIALNNSSQSREMVNWWCRKLSNQCFNEPETGLFVDQKWMNLVPGLFDSVYITRHQGMNVAYWNLHERFLNNNLVNDKDELIFFHFSGFPIEDLNQVSKYQNRFSLEERTDLIEIFLEYKQLLLANGIEETKDWKYAYDQFDNGVKIGNFTRRIYSNVSQSYPKPFKTEGNSFYQVLKANGLKEKAVLNNLGKEDVQSKVNILNNLLRSVSRVIGIDRYNALMKYMRYVSVIRRQDFLIKSKENKSKRRKNFGLTSEKA